MIEDTETAYIQRQWTDEFDVTESALTIARDFGRGGGTLTITPEDRPDDLALIEKLAPRCEA